MKFRTRLYLYTFLVLLCTTVVGLGAVYWLVHQYLFEELRSKVLTIAATGAEGIDPEALKEIQGRGDIEKPAFRELVRQMRTIQNANRRPDLYVIYIYTVRPDPSNHNALVVGVDASADPDVFASPGDPYPEGAKTGVIKHLNQIWAPESFITDRWGEFLVGYAPIRDAEGQYVGTLGVNLSAHYVFDELNQLRILIFSVLALSAILGIAGSLAMSHFVSSSLDRINEAVRRIGHGDLKARVSLVGKDEFAHLGDAINNMAKGLEEHERLKLNFVRYVSKHVMEKILATETMPGLQGERRKITVLFSDIRDFTRLAEKLPPEEVVSLLNEYLDKMLNVIFDHNGTLDKFMGDGLMVEFGAPLDDPLQEQHAVETALAMRKELHLLNAKWKRENKAQLQMGIGIYTGQAVVGNIGSEKRMEYTAIGDTVNVASRLEHATKEINVPLLIGESTYEAIKDLYPFANLGPVTLPGRESPIEVYTIKET